MSTTLIEVRPAKAADAAAVASTHDEAWRAAYQGIIPGAELEKLINRRGPQWWDSAIRKGSRVSVLVFGDKVAGYANYGRNRARSLHFEGEIYELYLRPEFQGLGFGRRSFTAPSAAAWSRGVPRNSGPSRSTRSPSPGPIELRRVSKQVETGLGPRRVLIQDFTATRLRSHPCALTPSRSGSIRRVTSMSSSKC